MRKIAAVAVVCGIALVAQGCSENAKEINQPKFSGKAPSDAGAGSGAAAPGGAAGKSAVGRE